MVPMFAHSKPKSNPVVCYKELARTKKVSYQVRMATNLKKLRNAKGLTLDQLSEMAGISKPYLSQIENGKRPLNGRRLERLAKALGVETFMVVVNPENHEEAKFAENYSLLDPDERQILWELSASLPSKKPQ